MEIKSKVELEIDGLGNIIELGLEAQGYEVKRNSITVRVAEDARGMMMLTPFGPMGGGSYGRIKITATEAPRDTVNLEKLAGRIAMQMAGEERDNRGRHVVQFDAERIGIAEAVLRRVGSKLSRAAETSVTTHVGEPSGRWVNCAYRMNDSGLHIEVTLGGAPAKKKKPAKKKPAKKRAKKKPAAKK